MRKMIQFFVTFFGMGGIVMFIGSKGNARKMFRAVDIACFRVAVFIITKMGWDLSVMLVQSDNLWENAKALVINLI